MKHLYLLALLVVAAFAQTPSPKFNSDNRLEFPADYREWIFLSSGLGMTYGPAATPGTPQFDNVFVRPEAYREFMKTGTWPEGTMFVLEVRGATSEGSINKGGHFQQGVRAIEAEVKDSKRFPDTKWAFFGFGGSREPAQQFAKSVSCYACHATNGAVDNTFVQFYPTLLEVARAKGTLKPEASK